MSNFINPVNTPRITSPFGVRTIKSLGIINQMHYGVDMVSTKGDLNIKASAPGTVVEVAKGESYGKYIKIAHTIEGKQFYTIYAHLSKQQVKEGQKVDQGQTIGVMGATGRATGVHLHFEIRIGSQKVNPTEYLGKPSNEYKGSSIVDYLKSKGKKSDFTSRRKLAFENGFSHYSGTSEENTKLLKKLRGY